MNSSLDILVKNFPDNDFKYLSSQEFSDDLLKLEKQKGVYLYEYMDSIEKFSEDKLPDTCNFFSSLKDQYVNEKEYLHANNVWNVFKMNEIGDYHDLYLKTDLLLADPFKKFINTCLKYYGLDPYHYFSSHGLSWDEMFKMTGTELELIWEIEIYLFIENGITGGISYITKTYNKTNNTYMQSHDYKWMKMFDMVGQWVNIFPMVELNG